MILGIPNSNIAKFSNPGTAKDFAGRNLKYSVDVLMGDDGLFWVASTRREQGRLVKAGLEVLNDF